MISRKNLFWAGVAIGRKQERKAQMSERVTPKLERKFLTWRGIKSNVTYGAKAFISYQTQIAATLELVDHIHEILTEQREIPAESRSYFDRGFEAGRESVMPSPKVIEAIKSASMGVGEWHRVMAWLKNLEENK